MATTIYRLPTLIRETGYSRSMVYLLIARGLWPKPIKLSERTVGWPATEVAAMSAARIAGKSDEQIRSLVQKLENARANTRATEASV